MIDGPGSTVPLDDSGSYGGGTGIVGAVLGTGAALYDSYKNRQTSKENTNKTLAAQKSESELAYQRSVQMWNMQNAYNSPQAQMERYKAAGLNPQLIYGQGTSGNATSIPEYHPANLQYRYEAPTYGAAVQSILPTLMSVGTWLQNMRLGEAKINETTTGTDRARQMIEFLMQRNPQLLEQGSNTLSLFPYQKDTHRYLRQKAYLSIADMEQEYRAKYGEELFRNLSFDPRTPGFTAPMGGLKRLQFLQESSKEKLLGAKSSWSEFDVTDPQHIMEMVLGGVMGLAGQTLRLSTHRRGRGTQTEETFEKHGNNSFRTKVTRPYK